MDKNGKITKRTFIKEYLNVFGWGEFLHSIGCINANHWYLQGSKKNDTIIKETEIFDLLEITIPLQWKIDGTGPYDRYDLKVPFVINKKNETPEKYALYTQQRVLEALKLGLGIIKRSEIYIVEHEIIDHILKLPMLEE